MNFDEMPAEEVLLLPPAQFKELVRESFDQEHPFTQRVFVARSSLEYLKLDVLAAHPQVPTNFMQLAAGAFMYTLKKLGLEEDEYWDSQVNPFAITCSQTFIAVEPDFSIADDFERWRARGVEAVQRSIDAVMRSWRKHRDEVT